MSEVILNDANFETEVLKSDLPVLVDFYADWCGPCRMIEPVVEEIAQEYNGKLKVGRLNVDQNQQTSSQFGIMSIPTLILVKGGVVVNTLVGFRPKEKLVEEINKVVG